MKLSKKMAALGLVCVLALGQSVSAAADIVDVFTVSAPSCTVLNGKYVMTGSCSVTGHTYYMQDYVRGYEKNREDTSTWVKYGYGYNAASATANGSSVEPYMVKNTGSYRTGAYGGDFTEIRTKTLLNE